MTDEQREMIRQVIREELTIEVDRILHYDISPSWHFVLLLNGVRFTDFTLEDGP